MLAVSFHSVLLAVLHVSFTVCTIAAYQRLNLYLLCSIFAMLLPINSRFRQYFCDGGVQMSWGSKALSSCYVSCLCRPCHPCCLQMLWSFLLFLLPLLIIVIDAAQWSHREATIQPHEPQKPRSQQQFSAWMWHCHATWVVWTLNLSFSRCANHLQQFPA